jgi:hypothetical protein
VGVAEASFDGGAVHREAIVRTAGGNDAQTRSMLGAAGPMPGSGWVRFGLRRVGAGSGADRRRVQAGVGRAHFEYRWSSTDRSYGRPP